MTHTFRELLTGLGNGLYISRQTITKPITTYCALDPYQQTKESFNQSNKKTFKNCLWICRLLNIDNCIQTSLCETLADAQTRRLSISVLCYSIPPCLPASESPVGAVALRKYPYPKADHSSTENVIIQHGPSSSTGPIPVGISHIQYIFVCLSDIYDQN